MRSIGSRRTVSLAAAVAALALVFASPVARAQAPDSLRSALEAPWQSPAQWISVRGGYAQSGELNAPQAGFGLGVGYSRMLDKWKLWRWTLFKQFSLGGYVHVEHLGTFGNAAEYAIPLTLELNRHFHWTPHMKPYLGLGGGGYYRKHYRTGSDTGQFEPGGYLVMGMNSPVEGGRILGVDLRYSLVDSDGGNPNPVFVEEDTRTSQWGFKINYSMSY